MVNLRLWLALVLVLIAASNCTAQTNDEPKFRPALAYGGAPSCPSHEGTRSQRSEVATDGRLQAVIVGVTSRVAANKTCTFEAEVDISGSTTRKVRLPNPSKQSFAVVDFSADGSKLLIYGEKDLEYPNENFRNIQVSVAHIKEGSVKWVNVWDVFGWGECDATVEPQGFTADGKVIIRARPSVMHPPRRPNCVKDVGLYKTDLSKSVTRLPNNTEVARYGKRTEEASQACKTDPDIVGECFAVHGRLSAYNGNPTMRIWRIGTKRVLGVHDDIMPEYLTAHMGWDVEAYGDFDVCPFTKERAGEMQMVCIDSAEHVTYKKTQP